MGGVPHVSHISYLSHKKSFPVLLLRFRKLISVTKGYSCKKHTTKYIFKLFQHTVKETIHGELEYLCASKSMFMLLLLLLSSQPCWCAQVSANNLHTYNNEWSSFIKESVSVSSIRFSGSLFQSFTVL